MSVEVSGQTPLDRPERSRASCHTPGSRRSAPDCADALPGAPEPAIDDCLDQAAVYAAVRRTPGMTQRALFAQLVPVMARKRVRVAVEAGVQSGWLVESPGLRDSRTWRTVETPDFDSRVIEVLVGALEDLQAAGAFVGAFHRHRLGLLARGVIRDGVTC
jgi:hypothetical protein